ncbi:saccharopine dehydrogenase NADP-binding domain-containing protein [Candidatus Marinimicrobia bacterium]|nr:saccharopine dehydrogenase NADP-binding domain-containing protein [Candidatus Neomarinimicrobiota bacterium]
MKNIYQIGAGMVGSAMAADLSKNHNLFLADYDVTILEKIQSKNPNIQISQLDVTDQESLSEWIAPADIVLLAVPGFLGYNALKTIIKAGKDVVDISFSPENVLNLNSLAKERGATVIVDAGVAPGIPNYLLGFWDAQLNIESFEYYVGGLPKNPQPPFNYKAPFSPIDVIEEYIRPARMLIDHEVITEPALSDIETMKFEDAGTLEAFNTDGLRSLLSTMNHIPNLKEKTLRFPGHAKLMLDYRNQGLFDKSNIDKTSKKLFQEWKLEENEIEFTVLDIIIKGEMKMITYHLYDEFDLSSRTSSMARTTGYTATASVNLILDNLYNKYGVFPPEIVGANSNCMQFILEYLRQRNVIISEKTT